MRRSVVISAAALAALALAGCGSAGGKSASRSTTSTTLGDTGETTSTLAYDPAPPVAPSTTTVPPPTAPTAPTTNPGAVVLSITGTEPAAQVTVLDNGSESQHTGIPLPYSTTLTDNPYVVGIDAQTSSSDPGATITCSISGGNVNAVTKTSTGAYAVVDCSASSLP